MKLMRLAVLLLALALPGAAPAQSTSAPAAECVVLLHGLARSSWSLVPLALTLEAEGYRTVNHDYPSTDLPLDALTASVDEAVAECGADAPKVHFVTHSMGGLLVQDWLGNHADPRIGRLVMLGPPNRGSELVDALGDWTVFAMMNGPAGQALGTGPEAAPARIAGPDGVEIGIIAGTMSLNPLYSAMIPGPDDGKVSVASAILPGADRVILPVTHTFMMNNPVVAGHVVSYLRTGAFAPGGDAALAALWRG